MTRSTEIVLGEARPPRDRRDDAPRSWVAAARVIGRVLLVPALLFAVVGSWVTFAALGYRLGYRDGIVVDVICPEADP